MIYHRSVRSAAAAVAALVMVGLSAVSPATADIDQQGLPASFTLAFSAIGGEPGTLPSSDDVASDTNSVEQARRELFRDGNQISTRDLLAALTPEPTEVNQRPASLFRHATLGLVFEDHMVGTQDVLALADCPTLDLETLDSMLQEQMALCGDQTFTYGVGEAGLEVLRDGEVILHLPLEPGVYSLNGVPFAVQTK